MVELKPVDRTARHATTAMRDDEFPYAFVVICFAPFRSRSSHFLAPKRSAQHSTKDRRTTARCWCPQDGIEPPFIAYKAIFLPLEDAGNVGVRYGCWPRCFAFTGRRVHWFTNPTIAVSCGALALSRRGNEMAWRLLGYPTCRTRVESRLGIEPSCAGLQPAPSAWTSRQTNHGPSSCTARADSRQLHAVVFSKLSGMNCEPPGKRCIDTSHGYTSCTSRAPALGHDSESDNRHIAIRISAPLPGRLSICDEPSN